MRKKSRKYNNNNDVYRSSKRITKKSKRDRRSRIQTRKKLEGGNNHQSDVNILKKITTVICNKKVKDICCENQYDRDKIIDLIIIIYKDYFPEDVYLEWIHNDLFLFTGDSEKFKIDKNLDKLEIEEFLDKKLIGANETMYRNIMNELPLYYLLSFLGRSYYHQKNGNLKKKTPANLFLKISKFFPFG